MSLLEYMMSAMRRLTAWRTHERTTLHPEQWTAVHPQEVKGYLTYASALQRGDHVLHDGEFRRVNALLFRGGEDVTAHFSDGDQRTYQLSDRVEVSAP